MQRQWAFLNVARARDLLVLIYFLIALSLCHSGSPTMVL
jgi:hypothetical protein